MYYRRSRDRSGNQKLQAFAALILMYPIICFVLWILKTTTPAKGEFMGGEINMSIQKGFANWLYEHFVSAPVVAVSFLIAGFFIWISMKVRRYEDY